MSFVVTVPEAVAAAAGDLAAIGSTLREATAAAAGPTTGLAAAAADDVSIAVSQLFGRYGQEFQTVSNQLAAFHTEFVRTLNRGAAAYLNTESANGGQLFGQIEAGQRAVSAAAAAAPGGAYGQLVANTATNLESLYGAWSANPFPFLRQIIANHQVYWQQIAAALANAVQNFPALVANLPAAI
ncbi:PE family protein, partial [Mycobacterium tuberculosis]